ncbi:MAG: cyanophycinase, partial [Ignavibacteriaceae bacterium]
MKILFTKKVLLFLIFISPFLFAQNKGHLVIIGGGSKPEYVLKKIIEFAGGADSKIIVIPNASSDKEGTGIYNANEFKELGCKHSEYISFDKETANSDSILNKVKGTTGIYFSGGDQALLTKDLLGTKLFAEIKNIYKNGGVISGTSAGAAVMSKVMITGNELINNDSTTAFKAIIKNNVETTEGFGFITSA